MQGRKARSRLAIRPTLYSSNVVAMSAMCNAVKPSDLAASMNAPCLKSNAIMPVLPRRVAKCERCRFDWRALSNEAVFRSYRRHI